MNSVRWTITIVLAFAMVIGMQVASTHGQGGAPGQAAGARRGGRGGQRGAPVNLPDKPTAVTLPAVSTEITGPGPWFNSSPSLPPGRDMAHYKYEAKEYFISGQANGKPYKTRIVVRKPSNNSRFSGLAIVEAMHPSGAAHMFEFTSDYTMTSGHMAVEVVTNLAELLAQNQERYKDLSVSGDQTSEILAQVGSLVKAKKAGSPFANLSVRKMVMVGTSATAAILIQYLPAHMVYRTPGMERIYDGFLPMSTGATVRQVDVPLIQVPTMTEAVGNNLTTRADGDEPGNQFRLYEFAGMAHVDSRDSVRFKPDPCRYPASRFPEQAYMSVALHNLLDWVDKGKVPPHAERIVLDGDASNDGSPMALDEHGNAKGGIRNPYVDAPVAKLGVRNEAQNPPIANPSTWIVAHGAGAPAQMCGLAGYQMDFSKDELRKLYGSKKSYQDRVRKSLAELERAGWSLPVYRDMILQDAAGVDF